MTPELKELIARLEALVKRRLEQLRNGDVPSAEELERWYALESHD